MKKLLGLLAILATGACASGAYDGGGGGMGYADVPEGRYYDCLDPNAYPCGYYEGYSPGAAFARRTLTPAAGRRPMARLVERGDVGGAGTGIAGRAWETRASGPGDRMAIVHRSGGSATGSSPAPSGSGSASGPAPSVHSAPPPSFSAPPAAVSAPSSSASAPSAGSVHSSKQ
ncbi:MAG: hypothetical protein ABI592_15380 [Acidobacteriota bacterium]